ncbi:MAG: hypothetical protein ABEJ93_03365 [Candidatus Nanohalobium sp.]
MRLLKISETDLEGLNEYFDEVERVELEELSPEVVENSSGLRVNGEPIDSFDAVYANILPRNAIFGRVLLELIEERNISLNYYSTAFFTMAKKNYLCHVLNNKEVPTPASAAIADEKAARSLEKHLKGPLIGKKFQNFREVESAKLDTVEDIKSFSKGVEYGENIMVFKEFSEGDKYRCLVAGDQIVSLKDDSEGWKFKEDNLSYSNTSNEIKDNVRIAANAIGTEIAEVLVRSGEVVDINPNPDLKKYMDVSGKDTFKAAAKTLKPGEES